MCAPCSPRTASADPAALLELYAGPFLDGLVLLDAPEFELWLDTARRRVAEAFLSHVTAGSQALCRAGSWREATDIARRALAHDPLHEGLNRALMEALAGLGERSEALRQYESLKGRARAGVGRRARAGNGSLACCHCVSGPRPAAVPSLPAPASRPARRPPGSVPGAARAAVRGSGPRTGHPRRGAGHSPLRDRRASWCSRVSWASASRGLWREWQASISVECTALVARCVEAASSPAVHAAGRAVRESPLHAGALPSTVSAPTAMAGRGLTPAAPGARRMRPDCHGPPRCLLKRSAAGSLRRSSRSWSRSTRTRC